MCKLRRKPPSPADIADAARERRRQAFLESRWRRSQVADIKARRRARAAVMSLARSPNAWALQVAELAFWLLKLNVIGAAIALFVVAIAQAATQSIQAYEVVPIGTSFSLVCLLVMGAQVSLPEIGSPFVRAWREAYSEGDRR